MSAAARFRVRLRRSWLWWRRTWWFQLAHSPLCGRFATDVIRLGRLRVCRSCTLLYGAMLTAACVFVWPGISPTLTLALCYGTLLPAVAMSYPRVYRRWPRPAKDGLRGAAGASLGLLFCLLATPFWWLSAGTLALSYPVFLAFRRTRRAVKACECDGCPELGTPGVCSGYARQAEAIRAFRDRIDEELNRPGVAALTVLPHLRRP